MMARTLRTALPHLGCRAGAEGNGGMTTIRLTAAQAMMRWLSVQQTEDGGRFIEGVWAIFGHGNVAGIGEALHGVRDALPTWRGHNEQTMAHAAIAYAKAMKRRKAMAVTTSIGPGALNMVTAAAPGACQPPAGPADPRRRLRQPRARPGAAAGRGFRRRHGHGERLLPPRLALFRPDHRGPNIC